MKVVQINNTNGIPDLKLIGETEQERAFIKQLGEAGTLSCMSRHIADSIIFRPISITSASNEVLSPGKSIPKFDFVIVQNENKVFDLKFNTDPETPMDLNSFTTIKLQVKSRKGSTELFTLELESGLSIIGDDSNVLKVEFLPEQTIQLCQESYYYDLMMATEISNVYYLEGKITSKPTVTR